MQVLTVLALLNLVVAAVSELAILVEDMNEATTIEAPTKIKNILNPVEAARKSERRSTRKYGRRIPMQVKGLKKLCMPRLVPLSITDVLGPKSHLLDFNLFPQVMGVKRCNTACSYCGGGLNLYGQQRKVCIATATRDKAFIIQVRNGTSTYYEKLRVPVDRKCVCTSHHTAATTILNPVEAARERERRSTKNYGRRITKQVKGLKKLCMPRLVPLSVTEVLEPKSHLLDFNLFPQVVRVKRCNTACSYCGGGLDLYGQHRKVCASIATRNKIFIIQVSNGTNTYYEKLHVQVDYLCRCLSARHTAATNTVPSGPV